MLRVLSLYSPKNFHIKSPTTRTFTMQIEAPLMWWVDFDGFSYGFDLSAFSSADLPKISISTNVKAWVALSYTEILEYCKNYIRGDYKYEHKYYQWPNETEWADFCVALMTIEGVKDLIQED